MILVIGCLALMVAFFAVLGLLAERTGHAEEIDVLSAALEDAEDDLEAAHEELERAEAVRAHAVEIADDARECVEVAEARFAAAELYSTIAEMHGWIRGYTVGYREGNARKLHS